GPGRGSPCEGGGGGGVRTAAVRAGHDGSRAGTGDADAAPPRSPPGGSGQLADLVPDRLGVPAEDDVLDRVRVSGGHVAEPQRDRREDRKSTRLNSSHVSISYAVFCLK